LLSFPLQHKLSWEICMPKKRRFLRDKNGKKVAVVLSIKEYEKLLDKAEELWAIRAYDEAKASGETPIPLEQALAEIRRNRK